MSLYAPLLEELDRWQAAGRVAEFWLRDDDATDVSAPLEQLLRRTTEAGVPAVLAVIPMLAQKTLAARLSDASNISVWQHGVLHINNAGPGEKKQELVDDSAASTKALTGARERLQALFPAQAEPVLVPPWNRIAAPLVPRLPEAGFAGLSAFKPRRGPQAAKGVWQVNTHIDLIDWKGGRGCRAGSSIYHAIANHLAMRRTGMADPAEPTGILSHHLMMEEPAWVFLSDLFLLTNSHPAARWCIPDRQQK